VSRWKKEEAKSSALYMRTFLNDPDKGEARRIKAAEYAKGWRSRNKNKKILIQKRSYNIIRLECLRHYSGQGVPSCRCCGETMLAFLHLDHIDGDGADFRRKWTQEHKKVAGGTGLYYWLKKEGWPDLRLQVLCANCNLGKRAGLYCPHELERGHDLNGNSIPEEAYVIFPELTRRRRGEARAEAERLGTTTAALRQRKYKDRLRVLKTDPPRTNGNDGKLICKHGHILDEPNAYTWAAIDGKTHRQCRQCKRDYKNRVKQRETAILAA